MKFIAHKMFTFIGIWLLLTLPVGRLIRADTRVRNCTNKAPETTIAEAVTAIIGLAPAGDLRELFAHALRLRGPAVPNSDKQKYWEEMRTKPLTEALLR